MENKVVTAIGYMFAAGFKQLLTVPQVCFNLFRLPPFEFFQG